MAWSENEVREFIINSARASARQEIGDEEELLVDGSTNLVASGLLDSMGFMNFLVSVEEHFGVEVDLDNSEPSEFTSVDGLTGAVVRSLGLDR